MRSRMWPGLWLAVLCLCLLSFLTVSAGAALPFQNAYTVMLSDSGDLNRYLPDPLDDFSGHWEFSGDTSRIWKGDSDRMGMLFVEETRFQAGYMEFQYLDAVSLQDASAVAYGIYIASGGNDTPIAVTTTVTCGSNVRTGTVYVDGGHWYIVYSALPSAAIRKDVDSIAIRLEYGDAEPAQVRLTSLCASDADCGFMKNFSALSVEASLGEVAAESGRIRMFPDAGGAVNMTAELLLPQYTGKTYGWYLAATVTGTVDGGSFSVGSSYGDPDTWLQSPSLTVQEGTHTYYFPLPVPEAAVSAHKEGLTAGSYHSDFQIPDMYRLSFQGVKSTSAAPFTVTKVEFIPVETLRKNWTDSELGSLTEATVRDGQVIWSGKLTRQATIDYSEADVVLLAVPIWDRYNLDAAIELARTQVSKNFTFTLEAEDVKAYASAWLLYSAVRVEIPVQDPEAQPRVQYLPITEPMMLSGSDPGACSLSLFGIHGADTVGVFESNVSHVTVDVMLEQLILQEETDVVCSFGGKSWHLSQKYLEQLDSEVLFYIDAGLEVSLRILSGEAFDWSDCPAENYLPLVRTEEDLSRYAAALSYLCSRYTGVASITLGKGTGSEMYTGLSMASPAAVMKDIADLAALTYETARIYIPDIYVVIPFADAHVYRENKNIPAGITLAPELSLVLLADAMNRLGEIPWVVSWRFEDDTAPAGAASLDAVELPGHWRNLLQHLGLSVFGDFLYRWEPEDCLAAEKTPYRFADRYEELCKKLAAADPRAVVLSLARIADRVNPAMYADMTYLQDTTGNQVHTRQVKNRIGALEEGLPELTEGVWYPLWDFADSYSAEGFVGSGGIESITTAYSKPMRQLTGEYTRVLRCSLPVTGEAGADGILLRNFSKITDLSQADSISFTFMLNGIGKSTDNSPTAVFFIGAEDWRMEYHVTGITTGTFCTVTCDIGDWEYASRCGYVGVMLSGDTEIAFDLASVYVHSSTLTENELAALFAQPEETGRDTRYDTEIFYILLLLTITTACVGILLIRRDREEEEEEGATHEQWK